MRGADYILLALLGLGVFLALRSIRRQRSGSSCCGDCSRCGSSCGKPENRK